MPRPFPLTIRSMEKDHPKTVMIILTIASILLLAWNVWFFFSQNPIFESSIQAKVDNYPEKLISTFDGPGRTKEHRQNLITAIFPIEMKNKILQNQKGFFFPSTKQGKLSESIKVIVINSIPNIEENTLVVRLKSIQDSNNQTKLHESSKGFVKIEITKTTPFKQLLHKLKTQKL